MVCGFPDVGGVLAVFLARLDVDDLVVYDVAASFEVVHNVGVGWDAVAVFTCLEGID